MFDIQAAMIIKSVANAESYDISRKIAMNNIMVRDTLREYSVYYITKQSYFGYLTKNSERNLKYFTDNNAGYQDLYQIALINGLRNKVGKSIYTILVNLLCCFKFHAYLANQQLYEKLKNNSLFVQTLSWVGNGCSSLVYKLIYFQKSGFKLPIVHPFNRGEC